MPIHVENPFLIIFRVKVHPKDKIKFADWQAHLNSDITGFPGFISIEFLKPSEKMNGWVIVQRFSNKNAAKSWKESEIFHELKTSLRALAENHEIDEVSSDEEGIKEGVTEVIITRVSPEKEKAFREWSAKIHQIEAKFPGFRGAYMQSPSTGKGSHWITLLQFDTMEHLDQWLVSTERQTLLDESSSMISSLETHRVISPYAGWFASIAKTGEIPPVWKQTMLVLLVLFPIVMLELKFLSPLTSKLNMSLATFIGNAISVILISFPMMPIAIWLLRWWLLPSNKKTLNTIIGITVVFFLYLIEILAFWNFF